MSEVIGRFTCPVGNERGTIQQSKRKGRHLLTRCTCCGFQQGTGAKRQQLIWDNAEWIGETPEPPANVTLGERVIDEKPDSQPDFDPETEMEQTEQEAKAETDSKPKKRLWAGAAVLGVAGLIAAIVRA